MSATVFKREPLHMPTLDKLDASSEHVHALERAACEALPHLAPRADTVGSIERLLDANPALPTLLEHRLSSYWVDRRASAMVRVSRSSLMELKHFIGARTLLADVVRHHENDARIVALCTACAQLTCADTVSLRNRDVGLEADADGTGVMFGTWNELPTRLDQFFEQMDATSLPPALHSLAAMVVLLNIHPFRDGNGRTARALFSVVLGLRHTTEVYLPLHAFLTRSTGGFELRLREAEILGTWRPLIEYFTTVFDFIATLDADAETGR